MRDESSSTNNVIGLYVHKESGNEMGCLEPSMADAAVRLGFTLVKEGREAALNAKPDENKTSTEASPVFSQAVEVKGESK